jgi:hypothetical protein
MAELNLTDKFNETKKLFNTWMKRTITPIGKVAILKSLILSKLIYLWIMLPNPPDDQIRQLQLQCYKFIWDNKNDKIKRTIATHTIQNGGIGIPHLETYIKSLKLTWLKKCCNPNYSSKWKSILLEECPVDTITNYGPRVLQSIKVSNCFWKDVFSSYVDLYNKVIVTNAEEVLAEPLFHNDKFKIDGKVLELDSWSEAGVYLVRDLVKEDGTFISLEDFQNKFHIKVPILTYYGYISTIKKYLRTAEINLENNSNNMQNNKAFSILLKASKGAKTFYDIILGEPSVSNSCKNWEKILNSEINWSKIFFETKKVQEVKLRWFQIKICYRILVTNSMLVRLNVITSNTCSFCNEEKDTIFHYLWNCLYVQKFWTEFVKCLKQNCTNCDRLNLNPVLVLFGHDNRSKTDIGFQHILLTAKYFIYKCRINKTKPIIPMFLKELSCTFKTDKYVHSMNMKSVDFVTKWASYRKLIQE